MVGEKLTKRSYCLVVQFQNHWKFADLVSVVLKLKVWWDCLGRLVLHPCHHQEMLSSNATNTEYPIEEC